MCSDHLTESRAMRVRMATSRAAITSLHWGDSLRRMAGVEGRESRIGRPNNSSAGDILESRSGVFLYWSRAEVKLLLRTEPVGEVLDRISRLMDLTATSARQLLCGK